MPLQDTLKVYQRKNVSKIKNMRGGLLPARNAVEEWDRPADIAAALCWHAPKESLRDAQCLRITGGILTKYKKIIKSKLNGKNKKMRENKRKQEKIKGYAGVLKKNYPCIFKGK